jgi:hypothetical protein
LTIRDDRRAVASKEQRQQEYSHSASVRGLGMPCNLPHGGAWRVPCRR